MVVIIHNIHREATKCRKMERSELKRPTADIFGRYERQAKCEKSRVNYNTRRKELSMREKDARVAEIVLLGIAGAGIFIYGLVGLIRALKKG